MRVLERTESQQVGGGTFWVNQTYGTVSSDASYQVILNDDSSITWLGADGSRAEFVFSGPAAGVTTYSYGNTVMDYYSTAQ